MVHTSLTRDASWCCGGLWFSMLLISDSQTHTANLVLRRMGDILALSPFLLSFLSSLPSFSLLSLSSFFFPPLVGWRILEELCKML